MRCIWKKKKKKKNNLNHFFGYYKSSFYLILFISFGCINLIGTILNCFLEETPIDLEKNAKKRNKGK